MTQETSEPSLILEEIQQFFEARKGVLNINPVAEEAGLSYVHLRRILKGEGRLTQKSIEKLLPTLKKYGYQYLSKEVSESSLTLEELRKFFKDRDKRINIGTFGKESGLSNSYLNRIVRGEKGLTQNTIEKLLPVLYKYGYKG